MRVLNFGSLNYDRTYQVEAFVEAGQTISSLKYSDFLGGKGLNQSVSLSRAGCDVYHVGVVGPDGSELKQMLHENGIHTDYIFESPIQSGHAVIQISQAGENAIIVDGGSNLELSKDLIDFVFEQFKDEPCYVLAQNEVSNIDYIISRAKQFGHTVFLNPSPMNATLLQAPLDQVNYFILNETEAFAITSLEDADASIRKMHEVYPNSHIILTLGEHGVIYFDGQSTVKQAAFKTEVVDTTCAGDTFTGYAMGGIMQDKPMEEVLRVASIASSLCIGIKGASNSIPTLEEVLGKD
ncbi:MULTISPECIES: ribokinase [unclassified Jeotgalibaca]|uniref:ribokinase n=1 Tax=unclassified Jeotgalibaca TaxID=2621505 RepID=UPI003FCF5D52